MSLLDSINLDGYSSSPGYCGFFSYKGKDFKRGATVANIIVSSTFSNEAQGSIDVFSSLRTEYSDSELKDLFKYSSQDVERFLTPALDCTPPILLRGNSDSESFTLAPYASVSESGLYEVCYAVMALGGLQGHLFIYCKGRGFCLYPHDDAGFGVISVTSDNTSALNFLDSIDVSEFDVARGVIMT